ncbi:unnamed protein product [Chrysodeixis includens]|uniref:Uncharacterized protein n=1 Tax=Chrysodeixis includens TaxID=689277 RepID=A0A9P0BVA9_CHRIL|nr:unnamed protein product [Chrysodeixis includens]
MNFRNFFTVIWTFLWNNSTDGLKELVEPWPVSECFCQHTGDFLNLTIAVKGTPTHLVTSYELYPIVRSSSFTISSEGTPGSVNEDKNVTYVRSLKDIKDFRVNLDLFRSEKTIAPSSLIFFYPNATQSRCPDIKISRCIINLDLSTVIKKLISSTILPQEKRFYCESSEKYHIWCLRYDEKGSCLSNISVLPVKQRSIFDLSVERFDIGMMVQCINYKTKKILTSETIPEPNTNEIAANTAIPTLKYNSSHDEVHFDCAEYYNELDLTEVPYVGIVDPSDKINIYLYHNSKSYNVTDNGTMLCCIYFTANKGTLTRHVVKKHILIFDDDDYTVDSMSEAGPSEINYSILYIATSIAAIAQFALVFIARRCRKRKTESEQHLELDTYATADRVLYAELDNLRENVVRTDISNTTPYATIIGSLHPAEDIKKQPH